MKKAIRQTHRWLGAAFTVAAAVVFIASGLGEPPEWVYFLPLLPLGLLWLTGAYLFVLPYIGRRGGEAATESGG